MDSKNKAAVKYVNLVTREVTTTLHGGLNSPNALTYDPTRKNLLITDEYFILKYNLRIHNLNVLTGRRILGHSDGDLSTASFHYRIEIFALTQDIILVADTDNNRLRVIDIESNTVASICTGSACIVDADVDKRALNDAHSLLLLDAALYVGQLYAMTLPGNIMLIS